MADPSTGFTYFGTLTPGRTRENSAGVVRRSLVDGHPHDDAAPVPATPE